GRRGRHAGGTVGVAVKRAGLARVALLVVIAVVALAAGGCSSGEAANWLSAAKAATGASAVQRTIWKLHPGGESAAVTHLQDLAKAAPKALNPDQATALERLQGLLKFYEAALATTNVADQRWGNVDQELRTLASTNTAANVKLSVVDHLAEHGKSIVHDAVCQLAWTQLAPNEHTQVNTLI